MSDPPTFETNPSLPGLVGACSLALAILRFAKVERWADLAGGIPTDLVLSDEQLDLLSEHVVPISYQRMSATLPDGTKTGQVVVGMCPECSEWFLCEGPVPARCNLTSRCEGRPVRTTAAKRRARPPAGMS